ncbi:unnamed protein product [Acanthoscelides obtectus]|uniref:Ig-like domain-containing protein n=1 Tax=Acanthoscelides obtectus TaxID=200917 RepID=A0A9P0KIX8_ACAOB|nr:unnamed protein product [Acanthoscelides obtectus]CAK1635049.1 Lachesin [Acanthoscelides obtectus]
MPKVVKNRKRKCSEEVVDSVDEKDGLLPSGLQVETGYLLNLNDVQRQDGGIYQCTASNGIGQPVTGEIRLHVLYPPEVSVLRSWVNSGEGLEAKLDCIVHADPPSEVSNYKRSTFHVS